VADRRLRVMPVIEVPPSDASTFKPTKSGLPVFQGDGTDSLLCGGCDVVLVKNVDPGQFHDVFIRCPHCGAMNDVNA
jgi:hypothetical protein